MGTCRKADTLDIDVGQAVKEYYDEKYNLGRDDNYCRVLKNILDRFSTYFPGRISDLTFTDAKEWIYSLNYAPITIRNHKKTCSAFFSWCIKHGYVRKNIFSNVEIMIVVAIIGLLAAIAIPRFQKARQSSHLIVCLNNLRTYQDALEQYAFEYMQYLRVT